jgi:hypothetical protein
MVDSLGRTWGKLFGPIEESIGLMIGRTYGSMGWAGYLPAAWYYC